MLAASWGPREARGGAVSGGWRALVWSGWGRLPGARLGVGWRSGGLVLGGCVGLAGSAFSGAFGVCRRGLPRLGRLRRVSVACRRPSYFSLRAQRKVAQRNGLDEPAGTTSPLCRGAWINGTPPDLRCGHPAPLGNRGTGYRTTCGWVGLWVGACGSSMSLSAAFRLSCFGSRAVAGSPRRLLWKPQAGKARRSRARSFLSPGSSRPFLSVPFLWANKERELAGRQATETRRRRPTRGSPWAAPKKTRQAPPVPSRTRAQSDRRGDTSRSPNSSPATSEISSVTSRMPVSIPSVVSRSNR